MEEVQVGERFTILDEEGLENELEVLATMELEGTTYIAVSFVEDLETEDLDEIDLFFLKLDDEGDFVPIEDDEEFAKISNAFEQQMADESGYHEA